MSHTLWIMLCGACLLAGVYGVAIVRGASLHRAGAFFAGIWGLAAGTNLLGGALHTGYSVAEEWTIFAVVFAVPVLIGGLIARWQG